MNKNLMNSVTILIYHSINNSSSAYIRKPNRVSPENFSAQMEFLAASKKVIPLEEYVDWLQMGQPIPEECFVITFDDGYKDNYTRAYPVLQKLGLPATFFLSTDYIGTGRVKWEDRLNYLIWQSPVSSYRLPIGKGHSLLSFKTRNLREKLQSINTIVNSLKQATDKEREWVIGQVEKQSEVMVEQMDGKGLMLSWEEVCEMAKTPGMSFGSHTKSHLPLSGMSAAEIYEEVSVSKQAIEAVVAHSVRAFSFPYGEESDPNMKSIFKSCGIDCAVSGSYGVNHAASDAFRLKRVNAMDQSGLRFWTGLRLRRSGAGETLRNLYNQTRRISLFAALVEKGSF